MTETEPNNDPRVSVQPSAPHISFRDVTVRYGSKVALQGVNLEIPRHELFAIIGPANSGKTTLLKCINRTIDFVTSAARRRRNPCRKRKCSQRPQCR